MIKLDILSDPICPWCLIGKTNLDNALAQFPDVKIQIEWHPFQLNPEMPLKGMDRREYLTTKFGNKENAYRVYSRISKTATEVGLNLELQKIERTPNTLNAHRLIYWSGFEGLQTETVSALFSAYFIHGKDIGNSSTLSSIAENVGLDKALITRLLKSDSDRDSVSKRDQNFREKGVTGVPTFIVENSHVVPGAQSQGLWVKVITELKELKVNPK
jgi:predicted DsbA family dithiol-disulfide isomerase